MILNTLKKIIGALCVPLAIYVGYLLWQQTLAGKMGTNPEEQSVAKWTLLPVSIPVLLGLIIFGYYAATGEYEEEKP